MSIVRQDTFVRANQTGWGTASDGHAWAALSGSGTTGAAIVSDEGSLLNTSGGSVFQSLGSVLSTVDAEGLVRFSSAGWGPNDDAGIFLRASSNTTYMLGRYTGSAFNILSKVSGTTHTNSTLTVALTVNTFYWLRFRFQASSVYLRYWQDGTTEPGTWNLGPITDTNFASAGLAGIYGFSQGGFSVEVDTFSVDDLSGGGGITGSATGELGATGTATAVLIGAVTGKAGALGTVLASSTATGGAGARGSVAATLRGVVTGRAGAQGTLKSALSAKATGAAGSVGTARSLAKTSGTTPTGAGTGFASLAVDTTRAISWQQPSTGSDSQTTITSANAAGDGWAVGINDAYGGMPFSAWYERAGGSDVNPAIQNGVAGGSGLTQLPTNPGNQNSQHTGPTYPAGHLDAAVQEASLGYGAAEMAQSFTLTELGPTGTGLRRRYHASGTINSITYDLYATVYPGEPGMIFWRVALTGPGSSLALSSTPEGSVIEASPAALLPSGGTLPEAGLWHLDSAHAVYGSLSNLASTPAIPTSPTEVTSDPDFIALAPITPGGNVATLAAQRLGIVVGRLTSMSDLGMSGPALAGYENMDRVKIVRGGLLPGNSLPATTTLTFYSVEFLTAGVSSGSWANAFALVADYLQPGSPTMALGSLTSFSYPGHAGVPFNYEEGHYALTASGNAVAVTLDLGAGVQANVRYKPRFKVSGFSGLSQSNGSELVVTLGGMRLASGSDYAITVDTSAQVAYVQLMVDLVASGASSGQKTNAQLGIVSPILGRAGARSSLVPALVGKATGAGGALSRTAATLAAQTTAKTGASGTVQSALRTTTTRGGGAHGTIAATIIQTSQGRSGAHGTALGSLIARITGEAGAHGTVSTSGSPPVIGPAGARATATGVLRGSVSGKAGAHGTASPVLAGRTTSGMGAAGSVHLALVARSTGAGGGHGTARGTLAGATTGRVGASGLATGRLVGRATGQAGAGVYFPPPIPLGKVISGSGTVVAVFGGSGHVVATMTGRGG